MFGFGTAHHDEAARHGFEGIHGGGVTVELVEDDIAPVHEFDVFREGYTLYAHNFAAVGQFLCYPLKGAEHNVCALIFRTTLLNADEEANALGNRFIYLDIRLWNDGEGDVFKFVLKFREVGSIIFIKSRNDAIAVVGYPFVEFALGTTQPVANPNVVLFAFAHFHSHIEIGVAEGGAVQSRLYPIVVHAKGTEEYVLVVVSQILVEGHHALRL